MRIQGSTGAALGSGAPRLDRPLVLRAHLEAEVLEHELDLAAAGGQEKRRRPAETLGADDEEVRLGRAQDSDLGLRGREAIRDAAEAPRERHGSGAREALLDRQLTIELAVRPEAVRSHHAVYLHVDRLPRRAERHLEPAPPTLDLVHLGLVVQREPFAARRQELVAGGFQLPPP